jgi:hypothetical protein
MNREAFVPFSRGTRACAGMKYGSILRFYGAVANLVVSQIVNFISL